MGKLIKLALKVNKANGQVSTYIPKAQLPKNILDELKNQPSACRKLLAEFRGLED